MRALRCRGDACCGTCWSWYGGGLLPPRGICQHPTLRQAPSPDHEQKTNILLMLCTKKGRGHLAWCHEGAGGGSQVDRCCPAPNSSPQGRVRSQRGPGVGLWRGMLVCGEGATAPAREDGAAVAVQVDDWHTLPGAPRTVKRNFTDEYSDVKQALDRQFARKAKVMLQTR